ncbi:MAG: thermonuclease family protein [Gammaproteobacteria bacterium]|nr:thermonuclease family protein [Gammaproteobacteria bacterium]
MRNIFLIGLLGSVLGMAINAHASLPEPAKQMQVRVINVNDGDTLTVMDSKQKTYIVQLDGIDAPEAAQPYGEASKKHLERRILKKNVVLMWHKSSKDGALIAKVLLNNGDINQLQLRTGSAWMTNSLTVNLSGSDSGRYASAQAHAKEKQLGLWRDERAISPWDWRKQHEVK